MPKVGNKEFDYTPEGIAEAEAYSEATGIPTLNAQDRSVQTFFNGGPVEKLGGGRDRLNFGGGGSGIGGQTYKKGGKVKGYKK